jgi:hypothetical protein
LPLLHNRCLSDWAHRLANGAIGGGLASLVAYAAVRVLGVPLSAFWGVPLVALLCTVPDPCWFSLVEGCAGDLGYDELQEDSKKEDAEGWGEAFDA